MTSPIPADENATIQAGENGSAGDAAPRGEGGSPARSLVGDGVTPPPAGDVDTGDGVEASLAEQLAEAAALAQARLSDLHRERAEFVNYRRRAERDIAAATAEGTVQLVEALLPVLDDIRLARDHGDLEGTPFAAIADKLDATLGRFEVASFGEAGEPFDPAVHDALLHEPAPAEGVDVAVCAKILQPGYRVGERVVRPARVAVADPA